MSDNTVDVIPYEHTINLVENDEVIEIPEKKKYGIC